MKLQIVILILGLVCLSVADNAPSLDPSAIKSVTVYPSDADECKKDYPNACCFTGATIFTTQYEGTTIQSFTITGKVAGNGCKATSTLTFIPSGVSTTATKVGLGFQVTDKSQTLKTYTFLPATSSLIINKEISNTYYFSIALQTQAAGVTNYQTLNFTPSTSTGTGSSSFSVLMKISLIGLLALFTLLF